MQLLPYACRRRLIRVLLPQGMLRDGDTLAAEVRAVNDKRAPSPEKCVSYFLVAGAAVPISDELLRDDATVSNVASYFENSVLSAMQVMRYRS